MTSSKKSIKKEPSSRRGKSSLRETGEKASDPSTLKTIEPDLTFSFKKPEKKFVVDRNEGWQVDEKIQFDMMMPIYIQVNAGNLYRFFSSALISAQNSFENSPFADVQSINPSVLLLSNGFLSIPDYDSVLLEILISESEIAQLQILGAVGVLSHPLPISRIMAILVQNESVKKEIIGTSLSADGGLIPERLFVLCNVKTLVHLPEIEWIPSDYSGQSKQFDKILGCFSFLANYSILMANRLNTTKTLPDHFLIAANLINDAFRAPIDNDRVTAFYKILFGLNRQDQPFLQWLVERMSIGSNFTDADVTDFASIMLKHSSQEFLMESHDLLSSLLKSMERKKAIQLIPNLKQNDKFYLYLLAILRTYGSVNSEDKSISRADLPSLIFPNYGEYTFACLGYFYGYKLLRNFEDRLKIDDKLISEIFQTDKRKNLKFRLNTEFDLTLVESVYQFTFNRASIATVNFKRFPQLESEVRRAVNLPDRYKIKEDVLLGKVICTLSKLTNIEHIEWLLIDINVIPAVSVIGARCFRSGVQMQSAKIGEIQTEKLNYALYFLKIDLINALRMGLINPEAAALDIKFGLEEKEF